MTEEERAKFPVPWFEFFTEKVIGRYVKIVLHRTTSDPWIIQRIMIADGFQPVLNMEYGSAIGMTDASVNTPVLGGAVVPDAREKKRTLQLPFKNIGEDEAMAGFLDLMNRVGTTGQVFVAWDPDDVLHRHRRAFLARMNQLDQLTATSQGRFSTTLQFTEEVA